MGNWFYLTRFELPIPFDGQSNGISVIECAGPLVWVFKTFPQ